ncbi:hypothetical protein EDB85DRAFT_2141193 [Lactarius pseudohatsudake]|nr:hypothetical protein EDB85DRAFT_2141193 [Lactarius pseudohatsudake]
MDNFKNRDTPVIVGVDDEDGPYQFVETEGSDQGSDTDQDNLVDDPVQTDIERFASTLREAQCLAVQIKKDEEKQKQKTLKTYLGNSKKSQYCCEKAQKALASQGFLDIASFMALKKHEREEAGAREVHTESANSDVREIDWRSSFAPSGTPARTVLSIHGITRGRVSMELEEEEEESSPSEPESGTDMRKVHWCSRVFAPPELPRHTVSAGGRNMALVEEEEEDSPGSEPGLGANVREFDWHSKGSVPSEASRSSVTGGPGDKDSEDLSMSEEFRTPSIGLSARENSEFEGGSGDESSDLAPSQAVASMASLDLEGPLDGHWNGSRCGNSDGDGSKDDWAKSASQGVETWNVTHTMNEILEALCSGQDSIYLTPVSPFDRALDLWKDCEKLRQACMVLTTKSKDVRISILLWTRLTGMLGMLNLYLDPALQYTWRGASLVVAKIQGSGEKHVRNLRQWILDFIRIGELLSYHHGQGWSVLEDEDVKQTLQLHLLERAKSGRVSATDVVDIVSTPKLQDIFSQSGITKPTISKSTACRWLLRLDWQYGQPQKGMYVDGHECKDVVNYRKAFVERWKEYKKCFHLWDDNGDLLPLLKGFPVPEAHGRFCLILVTHDESTFFQNNLQKSHWAHKGNKPTPVVPIMTDMCHNSCMAFSGLFSELCTCPECSAVRYESVTRGKHVVSVPRKQALTIPVGPQIQAQY